MKLLVNLVTILHLVETKRQFVQSLLICIMIGAYVHLLKFNYFNT